ncbi:MAG: DUF1489 domain-containing protein [Hyphomicrobiaceae bacterium]
MTVHMIKLCVGAASIEDLADWQARRLADNRKATGKAEIWHTTRMEPKRRDEMLDGGSLYWVIKGVIQVRQTVTGFRQGAKADGTPATLVLLDPALVPVRPTPRRAFQGWRYLEPGDAPPDMAASLASDLARMPPRMRRDLAELGLI